MRTAVRTTEGDSYRAGWPLMAQRSRPIVLRNGSSIPGPGRMPGHRTRFRQARYGLVANRGPHALAPRTPRAWPDRPSDATQLSSESNASDFTYDVDYFLRGRSVPIAKIADDVIIGGPLRRSRVDGHPRDRIRGCNRARTFRHESKSSSPLIAVDSLRPNATSNQV